MVFKGCNAVRRDVEGPSSRVGPKEVAGDIPRRVGTKTEHIREISFFMILTRFFGPDLDRLMEGREPAAGVISELRGGLVPL